MTSQNPIRATHLAFLILSALLFTTCLAFDGYSTRQGANNGGLLLLSGWLGVTASAPAWLANPLIIVAAFMYARRRYFQAMVLSGIAAGLMLSFLLTKEVMVSEAPTYAEVTAYGPGYWLWVASALILFVGAALNHKRVFDVG